MYKKKSKMKKRMLALLLAFVSILSCETTVASSAASGTSATYSTIIMQGNTPSASDCQAFKDRLLASGCGYTVFSLRGWTNNSNTPNEQIVTKAQFKEMKNYDVAYYSGHGGYDHTNENHPLINFAHKDEIDVAEALGVQASTWQTDRYITPNDKLRVIVLASCEQLHSDAVKYYARVMKASKVRAIAGYHAGSPTAGDDTIARNFVDYAKAGNSVWYSWKHANSGQSWAVLVYKSNSNQYYRLPGFPGNTYADPSSSASVYRYASFLTDPGVTPVTNTSDIGNMLLQLPLTITATEQEKGNADALKREVVVGNYSVADDDSTVRNYLSILDSNMSLTDKICVQYYVAAEEIDEDFGILSNTRQIVERTYLYYDTYGGIKIADSYISASVDIGGIKNIEDKRKTVTKQGESISAAKNVANKKAYYSEVEAIEAFLNEQSMYNEEDILDVSLAYAPIENGAYQLCYELRTEYSFHYVNVQTGETIYFS